MRCSDFGYEVKEREIDDWGDTIVMGRTEKYIDPTTIIITSKNNETVIKTTKEEKDTIMNTNPASGYIMTSLDINMTYTFFNIQKTTI